MNATECNGGETGLATMAVRLSWKQWLRDGNGGQRLRRIRRFRERKALPKIDRVSPLLSGRQMKGDT